MNVSRLANKSGSFLAQIKKGALFFLCKLNKTFHFQEMMDVGQSKNANIFLLVGPGSGATWFMEILMYVLMQTNISTNNSLTNVLKCWLQEAHSINKHYPDMKM